MRKAIVWLLALLPLCVKAQKKDSLLRYFLDKGLLTTQQIENRDSMRSGIILAMKEMMDSADNEGQRRQYQELLDAYRNADRVLPELGLQLQDNKVKEADTLGILTDYLVSSVRGPLPARPGWWIVGRDSTDPDFVIPSSRLLSFAAQMQSAGLASRREVEWVAKRIQTREYEDSFFTVNGFYRARGIFEAFAPARIQSFGHRLRRAGLLTEENEARLNRMAEDSLITDVHELVPWLNHAVSIDPDSLSADPDVYFEQAHRLLSRIAPELQFSGFRYRIDLDPKESFDDFKAYIAVSELVQDGVTYAQASYYNPDWNDDRHGGHGKLSPEFHQIFNKILEDRGSDRRLVLLMSNDEPGRKQPMSFILVNEAQAAALKETGLFGSVSYRHSTGLSGKKIDSALAFYRKLGLLAHLRSTEIDSVRRIARQKNLAHYSDLLALFPRMVYEIDLEYGVEDRQYREVTQDLAFFSRGAFRPQNIVDGYTYKTRRNFVYGFTLSGNVYRKRLSQDDDWLDPGFWDLIVKAMKEKDKKGGFYDLYPNDGLRVIYLTHEQHRRLKASGLLEFEPPKED